MTAPSLPSARADAALWRPLRATVWITACLAALAVLLLVVTHHRAHAHDPLKSPELAALKQRLLDEPRNEELKQQIRDLDLALRRSHSRLLNFYAFGRWLLLGSLVSFVLSAKAWGKLRARPPAPRLSPDAAERFTRLVRLARLTASTTALCTLIALTAIVVAATSPLPSAATDREKLLARLRGEEPEAPPLPPLAEFAANWPRFLGPSGNAFTPVAPEPLTFDAASGDGLLWKVSLSLPGFNSPIIWGNRVFLSGGDAARRSVAAFDLATGQRVWEQAVTGVPGSPAKAPEIPESTGFAASTMATDGLRVYAIFANGDLAAFTLDGRPVWSKHLGVPQNQYGHANSLAVWEGRVIVQLDQGDADAGLSKLIAFDGASGRVAWQVPRKVPESWASPIVVEAAGRAQIITLAGEFVIAHSAGDGAELWRVQELHGEIAPSPIFAGGFVLAVSPNDKLMAIQPDGLGDVTKTHVAWHADDGIPDVTSPVSNGELVFLVTSYGLLSCFDVSSGKKLWEHECDTDVHATPAVAGNRVYVLGGKGKVVVVEAAREFKELATFDLGEAIFASPAFREGRMVIRTAKSLLCVGTPPASASGGTSP
ncbi:MAG: PQQ-binding-like beta-propeller repeat protein [Verrucomicrobia bacterium]|nr:PQQ-binding-like beta-propeller repeat protein [Verrucomicrobiota bacterium]